MSLLLFSSPSLTSLSLFPSSWPSSTVSFTAAPVVRLQMNPIGRPMKSTYAVLFQSPIRGNNTPLVIVRASSDNGTGPADASEPPAESIEKESNKGESIEEESKEEETIEEESKEEESIEEESKEEAVPVDKLPLESKLRERMEQKMRMKLAKKIRLRRKRLLRKRRLRKKGRWPPSKMKKLKNV